MTYGQRIATLRDKRAWTQEELSKRLGISRAALSHYEKNRREPDFEILTKLADIFQVSIDYLVGRTNHTHSQLDDDVRIFTDHLELSDEELLSKFALTIDGMQLSQSEAKRFIAFVRAERTINS
jgi:transcriptional regulator with XRE-family HTH domain